MLTRNHQVPMDFFENSAGSNPASFSPSSINEISSPRRGKKINELKYEGDPDLQPIRSNEIVLLVRMLYFICCWINYNYKDQLACWYMRENVVGGVVRQVLHGPQVIYFYDRSEPGKSKRVSALLPPRLSLRFFADKHLISYSVCILALFKFVGGFSVGTLTLAVLSLSIVLMTIRSLFGLAPVKPVIGVHDISDNNPDISFT